MGIYTNSTPYFYVIKFLPTQQLYAGSKWKKGESNPRSFMTPEGYQTSSTTVNNLINIHGLDSFQVLRVDTFCDGMHVFEYEKIFLQSVDAENSLDWLNSHNNQICHWHSRRYKLGMLNKFGEIDPNKIPEIVEKRKKTNMERHGHPNGWNEKKFQQHSKLMPREGNIAARIFVFTDPQGVEYAIHGGFDHFCEERTLSRSKMFKSINKGVIHLVPWRIAHLGELYGPETSEKTLNCEGWSVTRE